MNLTPTWCPACGYDLDKNDDCQNCARVKRGEKSFRLNGPDDPNWQPYEWESEDQSRMRP